MSKNKTRTKDKYRVVYNDTQRIELENEFRVNEYIGIPRKQEIARKLNLSERQIKIWFQNRRAKKRKQQKRRQTNNVTTSSEHLNSQAIANTNSNVALVKINNAKSNNLMISSSNNNSNNSNSSSSSNSNSSNSCDDTYNHRHIEHQDSLQSGKRALNSISATISPNSAFGNQNKIEHPRDLQQISSSSNPHLDSSAFQVTVGYHNHHTIQDHHQRQSNILGQSQNQSHPISQHHHSIHQSGNQLQPHHTHHQPSHSHQHQHQHQHQYQSSLHQHHSSAHYQGHHQIGPIMGPSTSENNFAQQQVSQFTQQNELGHSIVKQEISSPQLVQSTTPGATSQANATNTSTSSTGSCFLSGHTSGLPSPDRTHQLATNTANSFGRSSAELLAASVDAQLSSVNGSASIQAHQDGPIQYGASNSYEVGIQERQRALNAAVAAVATEHLSSNQDSTNQYQTSDLANPVQGQNRLGGAQQLGNQANSPQSHHVHNHHQHQSSQHHAHQPVVAPRASLTASQPQNLYNEPQSSQYPQHSSHPHPHHPHHPHNHHNQHYHGLSSVMQHHSQQHQLMIEQHYANAMVVGGEYQQSRSNASPGDQSSLIGSIGKY